MKITEKQIQSFHQKVEKRSEQECWNWKLDSTDKTGYARLVVTVGKRKYNHRAHRVAYYLYYKIDPLHSLVLHTCHNKICCNPQHLYLQARDKSTGVK